MKRLEHEKIPMNVFPISIIKFENYPSFRFHWHEEIEIHYYKRGREQVFCNGIEYIAEKGDIIFINTEETHRGFSKTPENLYYMFQIRSDFINTFVDEKYLCLIQNKINDKYCQELLDNIIKEFSEKKTGYETAIKRDMCDFMLYLLRNYVAEKIDTSKNTLFFKNKENINNVLMYINTHYDEPLTVTHLAKKFYMSNSYFAHFFKKNIAKSVMEYVNDIRIEKAKLILLGSNESISKIATMVGYNDINYFSRIFKKKTGKTPSQYRKN